MEDDLIAKYQIALINSSGQISQAVLYLNEENNTLTLEYSDGRHEVRNENYFGAFCRIREELNEVGLKPVCYGASRNVQPSSMSVQMGGGIKAYKLTLGQRGQTADLVNIFSTGSDVEPVSVAEQSEFYKLWLKSFS